MTREEMIRKVMEFAVNVVRTNDEWGEYSCFGCMAASISAYTQKPSDLHHNHGCPVLLARQFLAKPVIEVGDVVTWDVEGGEFEVYCIEETKKYKLHHIINLVSGERHYAQFDEITLIRKRVE